MKDRTENTIGFAGPRLIEATSVLSLLLRRRPLPPPVILEYFTGSGYVTKYLSVLSRVTSVDIADRSQSGPEHSISFVQQDALEYSRGGNNTSCIVAHGGLHHLDLESQRQLISNCITSLKSRGLLLICDVPLPPKHSEGDPQIVELSLENLPIKMIETIQKFSRTFDLQSTLSISQNVCRLALSEPDDRRIDIPRAILERFVGSYRPGGHTGCYSRLANWEDWIRDSPLRVLESGYIDTPWLFEGRDSFQVFLTDFFHLDADLLGGKDLFIHFEKNGWVRDILDGTVILPWCIQYLLGEKIDA